MPEIAALTLVLGSQCNFSCPYCPQRKGEDALEIASITSFLDFLRSRLAEEVWLGFYGGEPLMHWPLIKKTVDYLRKNRFAEFHFTLTSNGSLLTKEHIRFFRENRFEIILSYDGLAQADRDPGSVVAVETALGILRDFYPEGYTVNSVFTPRTVPLLAASLEDLLRQGHGRLRYALDLITPWRNADLRILAEQLERLSALCGKHRQTTGKQPLENLKKNDASGIFACFAGRDRLSLLPDRTVWGCYLFHDWLGHDPLNPDYAKYCFGKLEEFMSKPARKLSALGAHYAELRQDFFFSELEEMCGLCDDLERCSACPAVGALATGVLAVLPSWTCRIKKITRAAAARFRQYDGNGCIGLDKHVK